VANKAPSQQAQDRAAALTVELDDMAIALDAVRAEEREACAEIAKSLPLLATDPLSLEWCRGVRVDIARAIRARGENRG
jgi:hypothetical protein